MEHGFTYTMHTCTVKQKPRRRPEGKSPRESDGTVPVGRKLFELRPFTVHSHLYIISSRGFVLLSLHERVDKREQRTGAEWLTQLRSA